MMTIRTETLTIPTRGHSEVIDITPHVAECLARSGLKEGQATVFVPGATAGVTTLEYEPGLTKDLPEALDRVAPERASYHHDDTWGDGNGHAHIRAALLGPSLTVPFSGGRLLLGTWQQIVLVDCDNRSRNRRLVVQLIGN